MTDSERNHADLQWRGEMLYYIDHGSLEEATDALLSLTHNDGDREWVENVLVHRIDEKYDLQIRELAVVCIGHLARLHHVISDETAALLVKLTRDPALRGFAEDALDDVNIYVRRG